MKLRDLSLVAVCAVAAALAAPACSSTDDRSACEDEPIDAFKELMVVDEEVLADARTKNATNGTWSFRYLMTNMAPVGMDPGDFVRSWLESWVTVKELNNFPTDRPFEGRDETMQTRILCPWYQRTPANACNADCSSCADHHLDLASAPFRLIAMVNRLDQREEVAAEPHGEGRFVFALTDGPADDPASKPVAMTVNFEYALPGPRSSREWAEAWHALGKFDTRGEDYRAALEALTRSFTDRGSNPQAVNGNAIGQVRTNESFLNWIWQQREFGLQADGLLALRPVRNTPSESLNYTPQLANWVKENKDAIIAKRYEIPLSFRGASSDALQYTWKLPGVDPDLRKAFAEGTCNGCHTVENTSVDTAFHVSPFRPGVEKLSLFVHDPNAPGDALERRTDGMRRALCGE